MSGKFNLKDSRADIEREYEKLCTDMESAVKKLRKDMDEICEETQYKPVKRLLNNMIDIFDQIHGKSENAFQVWMDGEGSYTRTTVLYENGDIGRSVDTKIQEKFESFWGAKHLGDKVNEDGNGDVDFESDKHFEKLDKIFRSFKEDVDNKGKEAESRIHTLANDGNELYNNLVSPVRAITDNLKEASDGFTKALKGEKDKFEQKHRTHKDTNKEAAELVTRTSASAEGIAEALRMFSDMD